MLLLFWNGVTQIPPTPAVADETGGWFGWLEYQSRYGQVLQARRDDEDVILMALSLLEDSDIIQ